MATAPFLLLIIAVVPRCDAADACAAPSVRAVPTPAAVVHADAADSVAKASKQVAKPGKSAKAVATVVRVKRVPRIFVAVDAAVVVEPVAAPQLALRYEPANPRGPPVA